MADLKGTFASVTSRDYTWPYEVPLLAKPTQPPMNTGKRLYLPRTEPDDCKCDTHGFESDKIRYKQLGLKEQRIQKDLVKVNEKMANIASSLLDSNCEPDENIMQSVYESDYSRKDLPVGRYREMMAAVDSPIGAPIKPVVVDLREGYRDPTRFRHTPIERPSIEPAKPVNLLAVPEIFYAWEEPFTGRSEYMDTISKMGLSNMKNRQQYLEPLPASKRRFGDCTL